MACEYWYDGKFRTEREFKSILENGLLDQLIRDKTVSLDAFEIDPTKIKNGVTKQPVSLRVLRKIDSNINNRINPETGAHMFQNPLGAINDFNNNQKNKKKDLKLKFAIKVGDKVYTGEGKENLALAQELNDTAKRQSGLNVADSLQEGAVYMLVPSAYGIYPIKVFTNTIVNSRLKGDLKTMLLELKKGNQKMVGSVNDFFLKNFYRLTQKDLKSSGVIYNSKKDIFSITRFDPKTKKFTTKEFKTVDDAYNFLGNLLYRVDYTKINKGNYNIEIAENNAIKTDVFVEDGSFFHSPSLVIQAYTMSDEDVKEQQKVLELFTPTEKLNASEVTSQEANKNKTNKSGETQGPLFNASVTNLKELSKKEKIGKVDYTPKGKAKQTYTVDYSEKEAKIFNSKGKEVFKKDSGDRRAIFAKFSVNENKASVIDYQGNKYIVSDKTKDIFSVTSKKIMQWGPKDGNRIAILDLYEKSKTKKPAEVKTEAQPKTNLPPGLSKKTEQPDVTQDLSSIIPGATPIETPITYEDSSTDWDQFNDLAGDAEDFNRYKPNDGKKRAKDLDKKIQAFGWTKQKEIDWLIDMLGDVFLKGTQGKQRAIKLFDSFDKLKEYLPKESYEQLLEARKNGEELYGLFTNAAVLISQNAPAGVIFHEAFHVVFNLVLPLDKRIDLIYESFEKYKDELPNVDTGKKDADGNPIMRMPTFLEVEELLADKFMDYTISLEKSKTGIEGLDRTFKGMNRMIKTFFSPDGVSIDGIFMDINLGRYVNQVQFKDTVLSRSIRQKSDASEEATNPQKKYLDPLAEKDALEYTTVLFDEAIEIANKKLDPEGTRNLPNTEIIREFGFDKILALIVTRGTQEYLKNKKKPAKDQKVNPENQKLFLDVLTNNQQSLDLDFYKEKKILRFKSVNDFVRRFAIYLQRKGIYVKLDGSNEVTNITDSTDYSEIDPLSELEAGEETSDSVAMRANVEIDPRESISEKLKNLFASFPRYKSERKNSAPVVNTFGVESKEDPSKIFNFLVKKISDSYRLKDMESKIAEINKPWVRILQEAMENDPNIKTLLWASIGSKHYATFSAMREDNGSYGDFISNRKKVNDIIKEDLISNFLVTHSSVFLKENNKVNFNNLNIDFIADQNSDFKTMMSFFNNIDQSTNTPAIKYNEAFWKNISQREEFFEDLIKPLNNLGFNITTNELLSILDINKSGEALKQDTKIIDDILITFEKVLDTLESGDNIFTTSIPTAETNRDDRRKARTLLEDLAKKLEPILNREVVSSFVGIGGKAKYNLINSAHLNKEIDKLSNPERFEEYLENISEDPFMSQLPIIKDLQDDSLGLQKILKKGNSKYRNKGVFVFDGFIRKGKIRSADYSSMSDIELAATDMAFFDRNNSKDAASFRLSMPSDSPTVFYIDGIKLSREEIIAKTLETAKAEAARIGLLNNLSEDSKLFFVKNYFKKGRDFKVLSFLNEPFENAEGNLIDLKKEFNEEAALERITEFFSNDVTSDGFFKAEIKKFINKGIINNVNLETGIIEFSEGVIDSNIKDKTAFFKEYLLNHFYYNTQFNSLLNKDSAFYKDATDQQKRSKQQVSPGIYPASEGRYKAMIIKDGIVPTRNSLINFIFDKIDASDTMTDSEKESLKISWAAKSQETLEKNPSKYDGNNISDGATIVSIEHRRKFLNDLGRLGEAEIKALDNIKKGIESIEDFMLINSPTKPEKPYDVSSYILEGIEVPFQAKNAEIVLGPSLALKKDSSGKYINPKLAAAYMDMNGPNKKYDVLYYDSAVKVGGLGVSINKKGDVEFADYIYDSKTDAFKLSHDNIINTPSGFLELNWADLRLQQETPEHYSDDRSNFGTQLRNLVIADIQMDEYYVIGDYEMLGSDVVGEYQKLVVQNLKESFEEVRKDFENKDGTINYDFLVKKLKEEIINREMGNEYLEALAPVQEVLGNNGSKTALPLYHPLISYKMESLMNSFFKNRITKQKIKGGQLVNAPSWGFSKQLEVIEDPETGGIIFEALIPWTSRKLFPTNKDGEVDIDAIKKHAPELLDIVANRIPTEDKYSMFSIRIKGFTPQSMGGVIIMPPEALTISGFDFDIDKLFFMSREFNIDKNGNPKVVQFYSTENKDDINEIAKNIFSSFRDFKRFLYKTNFTEEYIEGLLELKREGIDARNTAKDAKENTFNSKEHKKIMLKIKSLKLARKNSDNQGTIDKYTEDIDELYATMEENYAPFNEEISLVDKTNLAIIDEISQKIEEGVNNGTLTDMDFNGKRSRNNQLINLIEGILRSKHTAASILQVADTSVLKDKGNQMILFKAGLKKEAKALKGEALKAKAEEIKSEDQNINYPSTQLDFFRANMDGKKLIGPFANHNTHHAKAQYTNLRLREPIFINGKFYQYLNKSVVDGVRISRTLATNLAAIVDNTKDPVANPLNMNSFTIDVIAFQNRLGIPQDFTYALLNQPAMVKLTQKYFNEQGSMSEERQISSFKKELRDKIAEKFKESNISDDKVKELGEVEITTELLEDNIFPNNSFEHLYLQMRAVSLFITQKEIALELSRGVQAGKVDTQGVGPSSANNFVILEKQKLINDAEILETSMIEGLDQIYMSRVSKQIMIPAFNKYGIRLPSNIMNKIFPAYGTVETMEEENNDTAYSALGHLKRKMGANKRSGVLSEKEASMVDMQFMNFIASAFPFFKYSENKDMILNFPEKFKEFKNSLSKDSPLKLLFDQIYIVQPDIYSFIPRLEYYNTGKNSIDHYFVRQTWERMLLDSNPQIKDFALNMIKYTYFANGLGYGAKSFSNLIPVKFYTDDYQLKNNIVDSRGNTFNQFLQQSLFSEKFEAGQSKFAKRFYDQFYRNFAPKEGFVRSVTIKKQAITEQQVLPLNEQEQNRLETLTAYESKEGAVLTSNGNLVINRRKNTDLVTKHNYGLPVEYIKVFRKTRYSEFGNKIPDPYKVDIYKLNLDSITKGLQNPNDFEGKKGLDTWTYTPISNLGLEGISLEFNFTEDIADTALALAPKIEKKSAANHIKDSQMSEEEAIALMQQEEIQNTTVPVIVPSIKNKDQAEEFIINKYENIIKEGQFTYVDVKGKPPVGFKVIKVDGDNITVRNEESNKEKTYSEKEYRETFNVPIDEGFAIRNSKGLAEVYNTGDKTKDGETIYSLEINLFNESDQGQGLGKAIYLGAIEEIRKRGGTLTPGAVVEGNKVWESFDRDGLVKETTDTNGNNIFVFDMSKSTQQTSEVKNPLAGLASIDSSLTENAAKEASNSYNRYIEVLNTLDESKRKSNFITEDEFNKLNSEEQETALQQIKKC